MPDTKHKANCTRVFKHYDLTCPRCLELANGSKPRDGWQAAHYRLAAHNEEMTRLSIAAHFAPNGPHATGKCGPVCTFGDW